MNRGLKILALAITIALGLQASASAQEGKRCQTDEYLRQWFSEQQRSEMPGRSAFENWLKEGRIEAGRLATDTNVYQIPVVVHIIHKGEALGIGTNVSDERVRSQIQILNEDYRRKVGTLGFNTDQRGADAMIEFVLARRAEDSTPSSGIIRIDGGNRDWSIGDDATLKGLSRWNPAKYLNLHICDVAGSFIGYSSFPLVPGWNFDPNAPNTEGVVIDYKAFGLGSESRLYNKGRTATHEIGHYLGLLHLWGDQASCGGDDFCTDTPNQNGEINLCPTTAVACPGSTDPMIPNYLNYTNDICMNIFTTDQVTRMRYVMRNGLNRRSLTNSVGLVANKPQKARKTMVVVDAAYADDFISITDTGPLAVKKEVVVIDIKGRLLYGFDSYSASEQVNTKGFSLGMYVVKVRKGGEVVTKKIAITN